ENRHARLGDDGRQAGNVARARRARPRVQLRAQPGSWVGSRDGPGRGPARRADAPPEPGVLRRRRAGEALVATPDQRRQLRARGGRTASPRAVPGTGRATDGVNGVECGGRWRIGSSVVRGRVAERVGFEPTVGFPLHTLSKRAPSTTRTSLRFGFNELRAV